MQSQYVMTEYKVFETERLRLKATSVADAKFILELMNTPKWIEYIGDRNIKTIDSAKAYIANKMMPQLQRLGYSSYTILRKADDAKIGTCGLFDREGLEGIDIGFAFLPEYEKKGYALEAANKLKDMAFNEFGIPELCAITAKNNSASQALLGKIGLKRSGTMQLPNEDEVVLVYKLKK
jgi:RimJ/RimL family protein N-acetyltransferase